MTAILVPSAPTVQPGRPNLVRHIVDIVVLTGRNLVHIAREPLQLSDVTIQPVLFTALFVYVFGAGVILPRGGSYADFAIAGMLALNLTTSAMGTAVGLSNDVGHRLQCVGPDGPHAGGASGHRRLEPGERRHVSSPPVVRQSQSLRVHPCLADATPSCGVAALVGRPAGRVRSPGRLPVSPANDRVSPGRRPPASTRLTQPPAGRHNRRATPAPPGPPATNPARRPAQPAG